METINKSVTQVVYLLVALASIFIIILGIQSSAYIINSILLAAVITIGVLPLPRKMIQRGTRPSVAFIVSLLLVVIGLGLLLFLTFTSIGNVTSELPPSDAGQPATSEPETGQNPLEEYLGSTQGLVSAETAGQILATVVAIAGQVIAQFIVVLLIFIFMLSAVVSTPKIDQLQGATNSQFAARITNLTQEVQQYLSITTIVNLAVGAANALLLFILGVPGAVLWGIIAWIMGYIPAVGFWIALIPPVLLAWVTLGFPTALIVFIGYVLINGSVENLVKPRLMGQGLNISPLVVFISVFFWGWVLGATGAFLAVPLTLMILSTLESLEATRWVAVLARPATPAREEERSEAHSKLKDVWKKASETAKKGIIG